VLLNNWVCGRCQLRRTFLQQQCQAMQEQTRNNAYASLLVAQVLKHCMPRSLLVGISIYLVAVLVRRG
jgi:hypothetical protein